MAKPLEEYERKRDFNATPEPSGKGGGPNARTRCSSAYKSMMPATCTTTSAWNWTAR